MQASASAESAGWSREETGRLGLWLFLLSEILLFGGFFAGYVMSRWGSSVCRLGVPAWPEGSAVSALWLAALNTFLLITSSYTMARATLAAREGDARAFSRGISATIALGAAFLTVKGIEYSLKFEHGYYPGGAFLQANPGYGFFFSYYFAMTGLHAVHVLAGMAWNALLLVSRERAGGGPGFAHKVECAGIYWHFVDLVWVFLFPLFYLV